MNDSFEEKIARTRTNKEKKVSGGMVETRGQNSSKERKAMLEVRSIRTRPWMRNRKYMDRRGEETEAGQ